VPILDWMTRREDVVAAARVPYRMLEAVPALDGGDADPANMLIQGDNLEALKSLLPFYAGRVKCIYIDPPYNTRSAFEHYDDNLEHAQWLAMIYPRLVLLRDLLAEDGSIWVSIDDNEGHYLKVVMDEVFGRRNFIANVIWQKRFSPNSTAQYLSDSHDHVIVYRKQEWERNLLERTAKSDVSYKNPDNDPRGIWTSSDLSARNFYSAGSYSVTSPTGRIIDGPPPGRYWTISKEKFLALEAEKRIWWGAKGDNQPRFKRFLSDVRGGVVPQTIWEYNDVGHTQEAKKEVLAFNSHDVFGTPKPERLVHRILHIATNPGDLVLDSFLGSGTTAAVAHKMGRRWIGIEMGDHAETHCKPRLDKVIAGEQGGVSTAVGWQGGGGYRYYRLGPPAFDATGRIEPDIGFDALSAHIWFAETGHPASRTDGKRSPVLGVHNGTAYALLYNGILGDRSVIGGNVLTAPLFAQLAAALPDHAGPWVIYGEACRMAPARLCAGGMTFKQTPYDVRAR
jgi:adenine-specific DNA-methyltransferase